MEVEWGETGRGLPPQCPPLLPAAAQLSPWSPPPDPSPPPTPPNPPHPPPVITGEVLGYLRDSGGAGEDEVARGDALRALCDLAERFAPDHQWYVDTMNQLFEVAGAGQCTS